MSKSQLSAKAGQLQTLSTLTYGSAEPSALTFDANSELWVAVTSGPAGLVSRYSPANDYSQSAPDAIINSSQVDHPVALAVRHADGDVFVLGSGNGQVAAFTPPNFAGSGLYNVASDGVLFSNQSYNAIVTSLGASLYAYISSSLSANIGVAASGQCSSGMLDVDGNLAGICGGNGFLFKNSAPNVSGLLFTTPLQLGAATALATYPNP